MKMGILGRPKLLVPVAIGAVAALAYASGSRAQEKCARTIDLNAAKSKYTEQHVMDVGDVPGHQIRIYEIHRTFPNDEPNCEGLKRRESWIHGLSDYVNLNGQTSGYTVTTFENGDKIFSTYSGTSHTVVMPDGKKRSIYTGTATYIRGTGRYQGIHGLTRDRIIFDPVANVNVGESYEEYWIEK